MIEFNFTEHFILFSNPPKHFSYPCPKKRKKERKEMFLMNFSIPHCSVSVLYLTHTHILLGFMNIPIMTRNPPPPPSPSPHTTSRWLPKSNVIVKIRILDFRVLSLALFKLGRAIKMVKQYCEGDVAPLRNWEYGCEAAWLHGVKMVM